MKVIKWHVQFPDREAEKTVIFSTETISDVADGIIGFQLTKSAVLNNVENFRADRIFRAVSNEHTQDRLR